MKLVQINVSDYGSTGNIMISIQKAAEAKGHTALSFCGRKTKKCENCYKISSALGTYGHALIARAGKNGHGSRIATKKLVRKLEKIQPDVILLHNVHGYYINIKVLFDYLSNTSAKVFWTLHDCWAFTGGCAYFSASNCEKYKTSCSDCTTCHKEYPKAFIDTTAAEFHLKKQLLKKCPNITFISPSEWLANLASESFISNYPIHVINNGINTSKFSRCNDSEIAIVREKYNIPNDKPIVLGVSSVWDKRKNTSVFYKLSKKLPYCTFVMVGTGCVPAEKISNLISIPRTENITEMAAIYSAATVFMNLSIEDNFPLVSLEALACGTPVIASSLCGSPEAISNDTGIVVNPYNEEDIIAAINTIIKNPHIETIREMCKKRATTLYDCSVMTENYINLLFKK